MGDNFDDSGQMDKKDNYIQNQSLHGVSEFDDFDQFNFIQAEKSLREIKTITDPGDEDDDFIASVQNSGRDDNKSLDNYSSSRSHHRIKRTKSKHIKEL